MYVWQEWFAWRPVEQEGDVFWLVWLERRRLWSQPFPGRPSYEYWEYRLLPPDVSHGAGT